MAEVMIWSPLDRILWGVVFSISFICCLMYLNQGRKHKDINERRVSFGYSYVFVMSTSSLVFFLLSELQIPGTYIHHVFYGDYNATGVSYEIFIKYNWILAGSQFILFFYAFERYVKKTKYLITSSNIFLIVVLIILPFNLTLFMSITFLYLLLFLIVLLLYTKWSRIELKAVSALILIGTILITVGSGFNNPNSKAVGLVPLPIIPIFFILGFIFFLLPTIVNSRYFTSGPKYWKIIGGLVIGLLVALEIISFLYLRDPLNITMLSILLLFVIFSLYYTLKFIKPEMILEKDEEPKDVLAAFRRSKEITEEEITISKERGICVVCKGKLERKMYICPSCNTFYCNNCSESLAELENMCWVCNTPFDKSKPVIPSKKIRRTIEEQTKSKL